MHRWAGLQATRKREKGWQTAEHFHFNVTVKIKVYIFIQSFYYWLPGIGKFFLKKHRPQLQFLINKESKVLCLNGYL